MAQGRFTPQATKFCQLMAGGKKTQTECYLEAYPVSQKWTKASVAVAASNLCNKPHIQKRIAELRRKIEAELVDRYVWDKQKATKALMRAVEKAEKNLDVLANAQQQLMDSNQHPDAVIRTINKTWFQMNSTARTLKDLASELNSMYGISKSSVELSGSIEQVVFEGEDKLPPDEGEIENEESQD